MNDKARAPHPPSAADLEQWIVGELAARLGIDPRAINRHDRFNRYGLDSIKATALTNNLAEWLGRELPLTLLWEQPTVDKLVRYLISSPTTAAGNGSSAASVPIAAHPAAVVRDPIAIVGIACRFPMAPDSEAYWRLLADGIDAIREVPRNRWNVDRVFDADLAVPGKMTTRWGGFLDHVDRFDAQAFGISPREAIQMDPQQRLILELSSEALDDAGLCVDRLKGTATGVFVGAMWSDYARLIAGDPGSITAHTATGQDTSIIAARVSYFFGLQGPSLTVNTACSSSLVAVHLACQSLRSGESTSAIAGGVSLVISPDSTIAMSKFGAMAPDGRSKAFDARANGYVRGEGAGLVVLKPLSRALADGDRIYCLLLGSAVNNDGFSNGLTAPNPEAQERVLRAAYANAGIAPAHVQYVEAHGTGTLLGDPIEAGALGAVLGTGRSADHRLAVGSVKTNIGHLEAAAGIAGLIKLSLAMKHRLIPASLHYESPNPHIKFGELGLRVQNAMTEWPAADELPTAGVSSFGFGGTNCHVVVQAFGEDRSHLFPLTGDSEEVVRVKAGAFAARLDEGVAIEELLADAQSTIVPAADCTRAAAIFTGRTDLRRKLASFAGGHRLEGVFAGGMQTAPGRIVFVCSGHGSQWAGMTQSLMNAEPIFRRALEDCALCIEAVAGWDPIVELSAPPSVTRINQFELTQPLLFAIQVSLAALWRSWGIEPDAVIGHSMGEVAAAHIAGALSMEDAARVICHRSRLLATMVGHGSIAVLGLSRQEVERRFAAHADRLWIAACNGPVTTAVSGDPALLKEIVAELHGEEVFARLANADVPAHSPRVDPLRSELFEAIRGIVARPARVQMISTVTGTAIGGPQVGATYWVRNLREPVLFAQAVDAALAAGCRTFVELSPHPVLASGIEQSFARAGCDGLVVSSCRRDEDERRELLGSLAKLFVSGRTVRWSEVSGRRASATEATSPAAVALSGHTPAALAERAHSLAEFIRARIDYRVIDVAHTTFLRRSHLGHRAVVVASSEGELVDRLDAFARGEQPPGTVTGRTEGRTPRVAFVFCGQGSQWCGMGRQLARTNGVFRELVERCDALIRRHADWSLLDELGRDEPASRIDRLDIVQPAIFAIQVALAAVWKSWGVVPEVVVGHSMGEVAAAHVAGVLSLEDAVEAIVHRGRLIQRVAGQGRTAALDATPAEAAELAAPYAGRLVVAGINGPRSAIVSGDLDAVAEVVAAFEARGRFARELRLDFASHGPQMDQLLVELTAILGHIGPATASIPICSTVTGRMAEGWEFDASYWARNVREPIRFAAAVDTLLEHADVAVEIGPHPILTSVLTECADESGRTLIVLPSMRRGQPDPAVMLTSAGALHANGRDLDWAAILPSGGRSISLPPYPWQRERYWISLPSSRTETQEATTVGERVPVEASAPRSYDVTWEPIPHAAARGNLTDRRSTSQRRWLLLGGGAATAASVAAALRKGDREADVTTADAIGDRAWRDWIQSDASGRHSERNIIYLRAVDSADLDRGSETYGTDAVECCAEVVAIVQALAALGRDFARLWIVTRGAQVVVSADLAAIGQAPLWGLSRVIVLEHPQLWGGIVDLDQSPMADDQRPTANHQPASGEGAGLVEAIESAGDEDQLAIRASAVYVARLTPDPMPETPATVALRGDATYLITGGLGRLGQKVARWMIARGAKHLVLLGRSARPESEIEPLRAAGAQVTVALGDVSDAMWINGLIDTLAAGSAPLRGVVHAAGVSVRQPIVDLDRAALEANFVAKATGAWLLHQATAALELDFFVMFSSAAGIWGGRDMASYAAANHFLDALAHYRRRRGQPALSINWGRWDAVGVIRDEAHTFWDRIGLRPMPEDAALAALERLIASGATQKTVASVDWGRFKALYETRTVRPFLARVGYAGADAALRDDADPAVSIVSELIKLPPAEREARLSKHVQRELCSILGLDPDGLVDQRLGFVQMGLDSLMAIELRNRLQKAVERVLPSPVVFNYPNVRALAAYLNALFDPPAEIGADRDEAPSLAESEIDNLSDEDAEALLATRMAALAQEGV